MEEEERAAYFKSKIAMHPNMCLSVCKAMRNAWNRGRQEDQGHYKRSRQDLHNAITNARMISNVEKSFIFCGAIHERTYTNIHT